MDLAEVRVGGRCQCLSNLDDIRICRLGLEPKVERRSVVESDPGVEESADAAGTPGAELADDAVLGAGAEDADISHVPLEQT